MDNAATSQNLIKDGTDQSFMADVIEPSSEVPVIVDFWAPWCGPCKTLGPIIERATQAAEGKVKLVKINMDENPAIAQQLRIQSIPAVFAFKDGQPVDGFMGALPESDVKKFIARLTGDADNTEEIKALLAQADEDFNSGDIGGAAQGYASAGRLDQTHPAALAGLARCYIANEDIEEAQSILEAVPEDRRADPAYQSVMAALDMAKNAGNDAETEALAQKAEANPEDYDALLELAEALAAKGQFEKASEKLLLILKNDVEWKDGAAKTALLKIFEAAGPTHAATLNGRKELSKLLFS